LGFDVRIASGPAEAETLLAEVPADRRVAVVDARFVGHEHALRLGLTDPRFPLAAIPGAVTARPAGRQALTRALARENSACDAPAGAREPPAAPPPPGPTGDPRPPGAPPAPAAPPAAPPPPPPPAAPAPPGPASGGWAPPAPPARRPATRPGRRWPPSTTRRSA